MSRIGIQGTFACRSDESNGLMLFDISNVQSPQTFHSFDVGGVPVNLSIQGQKAYVARADGSVSIYDISDATDIDTLDAEFLMENLTCSVSDDTGSLLIGVGEPGSDIYVVDANSQLDSC